MVLTERQIGKYPDRVLNPYSSEEKNVRFGLVKDILFRTILDLQDDPTFRIRDIHGFVIYGSWMNTPHTLSDLDLLPISTARHPRHRMDIIAHQLAQYPTLPPIDFISWLQIERNQITKETLLINGENLRGGYEIISPNKDVEEITRRAIDTYLATVHS